MMLYLSSAPLTVNTRIWSMKSKYSKHFNICCINMIGEKEIQHKDMRGNPKPRTGLKQRSRNIFKNTFGSGGVGECYISGQYGVGVFLTRISAKPYNYTSCLMENIPCIL